MAETRPRPPDYNYNIKTNETEFDEGDDIYYEPIEYTNGSKLDPKINKLVPNSNRACKSYCNPPMNILQKKVYYNFIRYINNNDLDNDRIIIYPKGQNRPYSDHKKGVLNEGATIFNLDNLFDYFTVQTKTQYEQMPTSNFQILVQPGNILKSKIEGFSRFNMKPPFPNSELTKNVQYNVEYNKVIETKEGVSVNELVIRKNYDPKGFDLNLQIVLHIPQNDIPDLFDEFDITIPAIISKNGKKVIKPEEEITSRNFIIKTTAAAEEPSIIDDFLEKGDIIINKENVAHMVKSITPTMIQLFELSTEILFNYHIQTPDEKKKFVDYFDFSYPIFRKKVQKGTILKAMDNTNAYHSNPNDPTDKNFNINHVINNTYRVIENKYIQANTGDIYVRLHIVPSNQAELERIKDGRLGNKGYFTLTIIKDDFDRFFESFNVVNVENFAEEQNVAAEDVVPEEDPEENITLTSGSAEWDDDDLLLGLSQRKKPQIESSTGGRRKRMKKTKKWRKTKKARKRKTRRQRK